MKEFVRELRKLQEEMNRAFESFWTDERKFLTGKASSNLAIREPLADVQDRGDKLIAKIEMPGVEKKDLQIFVRERAIEVKAERKEETKIVKKGYIKHERGYRSFYRVLPMPASIDIGDVQTELSNGILTITARKKKLKEKAKRILLK